MDLNYDEEGCLVVVVGLVVVLDIALAGRTGGSTTTGSAGALTMCRILLVLVVLLVGGVVVFLVRISVMSPITVGEGVVVVGVGFLYPK